MTDRELADLMTDVDLSLAGRSHCFVIRPDDLREILRELQQFRDKRDLDVLHAKFDAYACFGTRFSLAAQEKKK